MLIFVKNNRNGYFISYLALGNSWFSYRLIMLTLTYFGKTFGMSSNLRTMCSMAGAGKMSNYFDFDWREQKWNLAVVLGAIAGGFLLIIL